MIEKILNIAANHEEADRIAEEQEERLQIAASMESNMNSSAEHSSSTLLRELAMFFASAPSKRQMLDFRPSEAVARRTSELLELNRQGKLEKESSRELDQFEHAETLIRMIKATICAGQSKT